jgi:hypothetical protein
MPYGEESAYAAQAALKKKSPAYMKSSGFKMKGSPLKTPGHKGKPGHTHSEGLTTTDKDTGVTTTRGKDYVTKSRGDKSATYNVTNTEENKDGSKTITLTNKETGHSYKERHSTVPKS